MRVVEVRSLKLESRILKRAFEIYSREKAGIFLRRGLFYLESAMLSLILFLLC